MVLTFHKSLHYLSFFYLLTFISLKQTGDIADVLFFVPYGIPKSKKTSLTEIAQKILLNKKF